MKYISLTVSVVATLNYRHYYSSSVSNKISSQLKTIHTWHCSLPICHVLSLIPSPKSNPVSSSHITNLMLSQSNCKKENNTPTSETGITWTTEPSFPQQQNHHHYPSLFLHQFQTMEDVWEGINLPSFSDNNTTKGAKIQDFLARPFTATTPSPPSPITVLSLNTRSEFHFDPLSHKDLQLAQPHHNSASKVETFCSQFQSRPHMCNPLPSFGNTKILRPSTTLGDIRNARLMKNRESAARSRARKQENIAFFFFFYLLS